LRRLEGAVVADAGERVAGDSGASRAVKHRRPKFTVTKQLEAIRSVAFGLTVAQAAQQHGVVQQTIRNWMERHSDKYEQMARDAWNMAAKRFPEACAKALNIAIEKLDKLDAFSAVKVLGELLAAWEKGQALSAIAAGSAAAGEQRLTSPVGEALRAIADELRKQRGAP
jgi:hypothetical protein